MSILTGAAHDQVSATQQSAVCAHDQAPSPGQCETACSCRTKHRTADECTRLANRLSRIEGQIRGVKKMVQNDAYCPDILIQTAAVQAALKAFSRELLASHIQTCVADGIKAGDSDIIEELMDLLRKMM